MNDAQGFSIELENYDNLEHGLFGNLLIGNGFSIAVNSKFTYRSLFSAGVAGGYIDTPSQSLFAAFGTHDFEYLLRKLLQAATVNKVLGIDHLTPESKYKLIKDSLIKSVSGVHPDYASLRTDWLDACSKNMGHFSKVFSLNYDLFPYWIAGHNGFSGFTDFFWSAGLAFDQFNTDVWSKKTEIFYPHGALFIFSGIDGGISKIRQRAGENILEGIGGHIASLNVPIFVSEGNHTTKLERIRRNPYLSFAYQNILNMNGGLVIFGASLSLSDQHIVDAIAKSKIDRIAYNIYVGKKTVHEIETEKQTILSKFRGKRPDIEVLFFDSKTSPLSY